MNDLTYEMTIEEKITEAYWNGYGLGFNREPQQTISLFDVQMAFNRGYQDGWAYADSVRPVCATS